MITIKQYLKSLFWKNKKTKRNLIDIGGCIAGGNTIIDERKSLPCSTELYGNEKTFRVYFLSFLHQNINEYKPNNDIIEVGDNPKLIFKLNDEERILVGFVFEKEQWYRENYMKKIEYMKKYMGFCDEGILNGIDFVNQLLFDEDQD